MITFVTGNANKLKEFKAIIGDEIDIKNHKLDLAEIQGSIEEICTEKALEAARLLKSPVITEDTCLCFNALGGLPGIHILNRSLHKMVSG
jgi:inosine triphosphate pyrophosphatase